MASDKAATFEDLVNLSGDISAMWVLTEEMRLLEERRCDLKKRWERIRYGHFGESLSKLLASKCSALDFESLESNAHTGNLGPLSRYVYPCYGQGKLP